MPSGQQKGSFATTTTNADRTLAVLTDGGLALAAGQTGRGVLYLAHMFAARWLGPVPYGHLAFGLNLLQVLLPAAGLGLYTGVIRYVAQLLDEGKVGQVRSLVLRLGAAVALTSAGLGLSLCLGAGQWARLLRRDVESVFWLFGAILPLMALTRLVAATINARGMARRRMVYESLLPSVAFLAGLAVLRAMGRLSLGTAVVAFGVGWLLSLVLSTATLRRWPLLRLPPDQLEIRGSQVARFAGPVWLTEVLHQLVRRLDVLLAGFVLSDVALGVYSAAAVLATGLAFVLEAFGMAFAPEVAALCGSQRTEELHSLYREGTKLVFECVLPICILMVVAGGDIMGLLGGQFEAGVVVLALLAAGQMVKFALGVAGTFLIMSGNQWLQLLIASGSGVVLLILVQCLVPRLGVVGLALAMAVSTALQNIGQAVGVYVKLRVHPFSWSYGKVILAGGVGLLGGALSRWVSSTTFTHPQWLRLVLSAVSTGVFYLSAMVVLGLGPLERRVLQRAGSYFTSLQSRC